MRCAVDGIFRTTLILLELLLFIRKISARLSIPFLNCIEFIFQDSYTILIIVFASRDFTSVGFYSNLIFTLNILILIFKMF